MFVLRAAALAAFTVCLSRGFLPMTMASPQQPPRDVTWNNPDGPPIPGGEHGVLHSPSMDRDVGYNVFLPPGYADGKRRYPVVYFLHGAGGNENSDAGGFSGLIRKEIEAGRIPPVICVFPNGGMSGYSDHPDQKVMGETLIVKELIPRVDAAYRTLAGPRGRAICGFSMGGGGAIRLALKYPDLFCAAASWAASLGARGGAVPAAALAEENAARVRGHVRFHLIVGDKDLTYPSHPAFIAAMLAQKLPHEYHVLPGVDHNLGVYYEKTGAELVRFVTAGFREQSDAAARP